MRSAIIGFGVAGEARLEAYREVPNAKVTAVADADAARRERAAALDPAIRVYPLLEELLAAEDVDLVDICTPPTWHKPQTLTALSAGRHVICEKPVATTLADASAMVEASLRTGRLLYPAHNYALSPMMRVLGDTVRSGDIGEVRSLSFRILRNQHARGVASWQPDWRRSADVARGGILLDHGTHCVYMALRLVGAVPDAVACTVRQATEGAVDEHTDLTLHFGQVDCRIELSWISDERSNRYAVCGSDGDVTIENGTVRVRGSRTRTDADQPSPTRDSTHREWFPPLFAGFTECLTDRGLRQAALDEIVHTARIVETAYRSARLGGQRLALAA